MRIRETLVQSDKEKLDSEDNQLPSLVALLGNNHNQEKNIKNTKEREERNWGLRNIFNFYNLTWSETTSFEEGRKYI